VSPVRRACLSTSGFIASFRSKRKISFIRQIRSSRYTIVEISMFEGRTKETKNELIRAIFRRFEDELNIPSQDVEITIHESPKENRGIRGKPGDELALSYKAVK